MWALAIRLSLPVVSRIGDALVERCFASGIARCLRLDGMAPILSCVNRIAVRSLSKKSDSEEHEGLIVRNMKPSWGMCMVRAGTGNALVAP